MKHLADAVGAGPHKHIVLVLDRAGWPASKQVVVPGASTWCSCQPTRRSFSQSEHLWPLEHEALANQRIETLDDLEDLLSGRCRALAADVEILRSNTLFHWWPIDYAV